MCHVLIIEDEPLVAMHIEALLVDAGATSFSFAASEDEAVASAMATCPGLITSDVKLVSGAGPAAVDKIRAEIGPVPVIFITATPKDCPASDRVRGDAPTMVLTKPIAGSALAEAFQHFVDTPGAMAR